MVSWSPWPSMPKYATGLPVSAMASATFFAQPSSMQITMTAATFGLHPVPMSVRKCSSRSAPNCRRPYGWGIAIVPLMLFATASAAALDRSSTGRMITWLRTPYRPFSRLYPRKVEFFRSMPWLLPAFRAQVLHVRVLAHLDRGDRLADVHAVLDDGRPARERADGQLVADRNVVLRVDRQVLVLVHDPAVELLPGLDALHHHYAHGIVLVVDHEMDHRCLLEACGNSTRQVIWMSWMISSPPCCPSTSRCARASSKRSPPAAGRPARRSPRNPSWRRASAWPSARCARR